MQKKLLPDSYPTFDSTNIEKEVAASSEQNLLYKTLVHAPAIICTLKGPQHIVVFGNQHFINFIDDKEPVGKPLKELLPKIEGLEIFEILNKVSNSGHPYFINELPLNFVKSGNKKEVFINLNCQPFFDNENNLEGISIFIYDVSEQVFSRNKIKESKEKYRNLIFSLPSAFYTCDADGFIQLYNDAAVKLWGRKPTIGKDLWCGSWQIFKPDGTLLPLDECPMAIALKKGIIKHTEIMLKRPDGTSCHVIPYPEPIYNANGKITGSINTLIDITEQVTARLKIEQTGEMLEKLYMNAPAFICTLKGADFVYELVNPQYQKIYGRRKLVGLKIIDAQPELKDTNIIELLQKVYTTGVPFVATEMGLLLSRDEGKEPEPTYVNFSYQPMYNIEKEIDGILVFGYEVTEKVLAKTKNEENLKLVLESLPQITSTSSAEGTNIFFNKFFFEYSGLSVEEATVNGWNSILHPDELEDAVKSWDECKKAGRDFYKEIRLKRKSDGMYRWHISQITAIKNHNGEVSQWVASATDIHEQKMKEQKKDEFLSIASHEMKTPLTTVKAYLQLLEMSIYESNENALLYTKKAILSVERLKNLISELLDVSKIQHGQLNFNFGAFDFNEMVNNAIEDIQYNSPHHKIIKTGELPNPVFGDKERLQQVTTNLLSNAIKYSPDSPDVFINISIENEEIKVAVKDDGIGIASNHLQKIFERYYRIEGHELHFQGLGIGLYISMKIVQLHHGKIWVESEPEKGSTFYFTLPLKYDQNVETNIPKELKTI